MGAKPFHEDQQHDLWLPSSIIFLHFGDYFSFKERQNTVVIPDLFPNNVGVKVIIVCVSFEEIPTTRRKTLH